MAIRYTDLKTRNRPASDFILRRYDPSLLKLVAVGFVTLGSAVGVISLLLPPFALTVTLTLMMGGLGAYVYVKLQRIRDLLLAAEFQNALFASSLSAGYNFCFIATKEGSITYMDNGTQRLFADGLKERQLTVAGLLKFSKLPSVDQDRILDMLMQTEPQRAVCEMRLSDHRMHRVALSVEPISRPEGYVIVRGRDYVESRDNTGKIGAPTVNPLLSQSTIGMFSTVMDRMGVGFYMADTTGNLLFANSTLERWLGFEAGEISKGKMTLRDVLHGISAVDALNPSDFDGEHALLKKQGGLIRAYINQKIVYGDGKRPLGCVTMITNLIETDPDVKKTLW